MKIEIWCEGTSIHGEHLTDIVAVRVPPDIKVIDSKACKKLLERRRKRMAGDIPPEPEPDDDNLTPDEP